MSETAEDQLIALVSREQRGLRRILFSGFAALFLVIAMSVALAAYYYSVTQTLEASSKRLDKQAFDTRRRVDRQANQAARQELAIRRAYDEIRKDDLPETTLETTDAALEAASIFLKRGGRSLASERLIESAAGQADIGTERYLFEGVATVLAWDRNGDQITRGASKLPSQLQTAEVAFLKAIEQPDLYHLGQNGLAWLSFEYASSPASNYTPADCQVVFDFVDASAQNNQLGPQPLYWRAQCERKLGRAKEAMRDYALALSRAREIDELSRSLGRRDASELTIEMNAYHGVGTVLIATADEPEDADLTEARALAAEACQPGENTPGKTALTQLAHACLGKAISLRERLGQTKNQVSGTRENISFAYLRDNNFEGAYDNTVIVEGTGLFAWNELIRALSASHENKPIIERAARRNVSMFDPTSFNLCEIQTLLNPALFEEAQTIVEEEHPTFKLDCN